MIKLKPNGPPLYRKLVMRYVICLLAVLLSVLWLQPLVYAEPVNDLEVEGTADDSGTPVIQKISHRTDGDVDIFTFTYRGELPETVLEMATDGLWMTVEGCGVDLPPGSEGDFSTPVQGELIGRLDVFLDEETSILRVGLVSLSGSRFSHDINASGDGEFEIVCFNTRRLPEEEIEPITPVPEEEPAVEERREPEVVEVVHAPPAADLARIVKVRYDPVGDIDRFTFTIEGPTPEVEVFTLKYPDRLKINISAAEVDLPTDSGDRFESLVPGTGIDKMVAVNSLFEDGVDAEFTFSVNSPRTVEDIQTRVDTSLPDKIIVDVINLPIAVPEVVEEIPPALAETPAIEAPEVLKPVVEEPVIEEVVEPEPVVPIVEEPAEPEPTFEEPVRIEVEPEPVAPEPVSLGVNIAPGSDGVVVIRIEGDRPFVKPLLKTLGYPTRIGLTLPYASIAFRGDRSGEWKVDEGPVSRMRAGEYMGDGEFASSLFVYVADNSDPGKVTAEIIPAGPTAYEIHISVPREPELPLIMAEAPAPEEIAQPPETKIEIEVESYIPLSPPFVAPEEPEVAEEVVEEEVEEVTEPAVEEETEEIAPLEVIELQVEEASPMPVEEPAYEEEPILEEEPASETIGMIEPLHTPEERPGLDRYPKFSLTSKPGTSGADRFIFDFDGPAGEPVVKWANFPPRVMLVISGYAPDTGSVNPYDYYPVNGGVMANRYKLSCVEDDGVVKTTIEIDAPMVDSPEDIDVEIDTQGSRMVVDIFPRAAGYAAAAPEPGLMIEDMGIQPLPMIPETPASSLSLGDDEPGFEDLVDVQDDFITGPMVDVFNVKDANIVDVLQIICIEAGISNIIDPSVTGRVSLALQKPMALFTLLDLLGDQAGFSYYIKEDVYFFASEHVLQAKFPEFYGTYIIELSYADPNQIRSILSNQRILPAENMVVYNPINIGQSGLNMFTTIRQLIIRGAERDIAIALNVVRALDSPPVQILYDVKVIQTSANIRETSGIAWLTNTDKPENIGGLSFSMEEIPDEIVKGDFLPQGFIRDTMSFTATVNYLNQQGKAKILANPTISALNGQSATYFVGQDIPYRSTFQVSDIGRVTQRVANQQVGITLNVTGYAASNDVVTMFIAPEVSNLLELTDIGPRTSRNRFATSMQVGDGETYIIAGLINEEDRTSTNKIPVLGDLPFFGTLFRNKKTDVDRSELIITITPHIIKPTAYKGPKIRRASESEDIFQGRY